MSYFDIESQLNTLKFLVLMEQDVNKGEKIWCNVNGTQVTLLFFYISKLTNLKSGVILELRHVW